MRFVQLRHEFFDCGGLGLSFKLKGGELLLETLVFLFEGGQLGDQLFVALLQLSELVVLCA